MPAYLKKIDVYLCEWGTCRVKAVTQLFNTHNAPCGFYCARHAAGALAAHEARQNA